MNTVKDLLVQTGLWTLLKTYLYKQPMNTVKDLLVQATYEQ